MSTDYEFVEGYPTAETVHRAYVDTDVHRAVQAYKFFYPTVSGAAIVKGNEQIGLVPNKVSASWIAGPSSLSSPPTRTRRTARCYSTSGSARSSSNSNPVR
jgi:V8-like Glu-specific endopeptidase